MTAHQKQWDFLKRKYESGQLSHAYLLSGEQGIGKRDFIVEFVKFLNCLAPLGDKKPCGCINCKMIEKSAFPDFFLAGGSEREEIPISKVKEIQSFLGLRPYSGLFKAVVVFGAEKMNQEAQSCLLKTLEEPKGKTLIFLVSSRPDMLLQTIISRCQEIKFFRPKNFSIGQDRLEEKRLMIKELILIINSTLADKFKYVKSIDFDQKDIREILKAIEEYFRHLLLLKAGIEIKADQLELFKNMPASKSYSVAQIKDIINIIEDMGEKMTFTNASPKLALEVLLMEV